MRPTCSPRRRYGLLRCACAGSIARVRYGDGPEQLTGPSRSPALKYSVKMAAAPDLNGPRRVIGTQRILKRSLPSKCRFPSAYLVETIPPGVPIPSQSRTYRRSLRDPRQAKNAWFQKGLPAGHLTALTLATSKSGLCSPIVSERFACRDLVWRRKGVANQALACAIEVTGSNTVWSSNDHHPIMLSSGTGHIKAQGLGSFSDGVRDVFVPELPFAPQKGGSLNASGEPDCTHGSRGKTPGGQL